MGTSAFFWETAYAICREDQMPMLPILIPTADL
jgi:hypothetical protein